MMVGPRSQPCLHAPLDGPVKIIVAQALGSGHDRAGAARAVAEAFRAAIRSVVDDDDDALGPDATFDEGEAMEAGTVTYPALMMARVMLIGLGETGLDLKDLHHQERLWRAVEELVSVHLPPA